MPAGAGQDLISIHALLAESDTESVDMYKISKQISIHALLAESDANNYGETKIDKISIHALLAESDGIRRPARRSWAISIHALLAESDSKSAQNSGALLRI